MRYRYPANVALLRKGGWIWFDRWGKDYGPYSTKKRATIVGQESAAKEEKLLMESQGNAQ